jgi:hypothetical protein
LCEALFIISHASLKISKDSEVMMSFCHETSHICPCGVSVASFGPKFFWWVLQPCIEMPAKGRDEVPKAETRFMKLKSAAEKGNNLICEDPLRSALGTLSRKSGVG